MINVHNNVWWSSIAWCFSFIRLKEIQSILHDLHENCSSLYYISDDLWHTAYHSLHENWYFLENQQCMLNIEDIFTKFTGHPMDWTNMMSSKLLILLAKPRVMFISNRFASILGYPQRGVILTSKPYRQWTSPISTDDYVWTLICCTLCICDKNFWFYNQNGGPDLFWTGKNMHEHLVPILSLVLSNM